MKKKKQKKNNVGGTYKKPRKKNNREERDYPGLEKGQNLKIRADLIDYDYVHKLSAEEKEWLNAFSEEFIGANFKHKGPKLHKSKRQKRKCYAANNARNRCSYSKAKANHDVIDAEPTIASVDNTEDVLIEIIDKLKKV